MIGPISDWHVPGFADLCTKFGAVQEQIAVVAQWELQKSPGRPKLQKLTGFKSKSGQELIVKQLNGQEHAQLIHQNWKFAKKSSIHWIRSQCENGLAFGVFKISKVTKSMIIHKKFKN